MTSNPTSFRPPTPDELRILRSLAVQIPLHDDPWEMVGRAYGRSDEEIASLLARWQAEGLVLGVHAEPNPARPGWQEALQFLEDEPGAMLTPSSPVRWKGLLPDGRWLASVLFRTGLMPPWIFPSLSMVSAGLPLHLEGASTLLHRVASGTLVIRPGQEPPPVPPEPEPFEVPRYFPPERNFWMWAGEQAGVRDMLEPARRMVIDGRARRFALRVDLHRAGMRGCGLAVWNLADEANLAQAAQALVPLVVSGDVAIRRPTDDIPGNLVALFLAWGEQEGRGAAEAIARQWNLPLARWIPLQLH